MLVRALRENRPVSDREFDMVFPPAIRALSERHWTPASVARRAATLLARSRDSHILDVGSGVGKFCIIGSLSTGARFAGIEQRSHLVDVARGTARWCGAARATFLAGDIRNVNWRGFDGLYLFNPFAEHLFGTAERIDGTVPLTRERYDDDVHFASCELRALTLGTRVALYHSFGTNVPSGFEWIHHERFGSGALDVWEKRIP